MAGQACAKDSAKGHIEKATNAKHPKADAVGESVGGVFSPAVVAARDWEMAVRRPGLGPSCAAGRSTANMATMTLSISNRKSGEVEILVLSGRLTLGDGTSSFRDAARAALDRGANVLVDLSGVDYIDSAGLGELVSAYASATSRAARETAATAQEGRLPAACHQDVLNFRDFRGRGRGTQELLRRRPHRPSASSRNLGIEPAGGYRCRLFAFVCSQTPDECRVIR